jgi:HlyD family secretion protein
MSTKSNKSSNKTLIYTSVVLVSIMVTLFALKQFGVIGDSNSDIEVETAFTKYASITQKVSASGNIQPEVEVIIRPDVSGEIIELAVQEGDFVREGDLLVRIKPDIYQARIDNLNAALLTQKARMEQTRAALIQAEATYIRDKELFEKELISELQFIQSTSNWESQKASLKAAEYQIESAQAQLRQAQEELEQTVIRAPQNGTVTGLTVEAGERVLGNAQMAGTEMMRVSLLDRMEVEVDVNENDIVNVSISDTARIEVDAYPNRLFNGVVTEIANSARVTGAGTNEQITNYKVKVRIVTPHNLGQGGSQLQAIVAEEVNELLPTPNFKPGMSASVDIETDTASDVVSVPIQAVTVRDFSLDKPATSNDSESNEGESNEADASFASLKVKEQNIRKVVFVVENGTAVRKEVETGISDNANIQISKGLDVGQEIVIGSYRTLSKTLKNNDKVMIEKEGDDNE